MQSDNSFKSAYEDQPRETFYSTTMSSDEWVLVKKVALEQQLGDYSLPQMSTSSQEKTPLAKKLNRTLSVLPGLGH